MFVADRVLRLSNDRSMWQIEDSEICSIGMVHPSISRSSVNENIGGPIPSPSPHFPLYRPVLPPSVHSRVQQIFYSFIRDRQYTGHSFEECLGPSGRGAAGERGRVTHTSIGILVAERYIAEIPLRYKDRADEPGFCDIVTV
ncbi:hypothetical protein EVAR_80977_1 [Eumeta japonica]|uniref:Uncharacterized protein n=1 Tax=Eumeta variegata TaxID=151549 RepID=A0A4C1WSB0_EUMVA|nr:hypothetical protein EVAR_80977_1 [Eumeta japonica]